MRKVTIDELQEGMKLARDVFTQYSPHTT